ncbi:hypothetical protein MMC10_011400 [Thelotrema lepadinum]|nr:hypothetical protein [Thelotrema lepadinum]
MPPPPGNTEFWSDNIVYHVGELVNIQWKASNLTNSHIQIVQVQWNNNSFVSNAPLMGLSCPLFSFDDEKNHTRLRCLFPTDIVENATNSAWQVTLQYGATIFDLTPNKLTAGNVFWLGMYNNVNSKASFQTRTFNITAASANTPSSTSTAAVSLSTGTIANSPTGLTASQEAGIGVGVGLVGVLAITALVLYFFQFRRQQAPAPRVKARQLYSAHVGHGTESNFNREMREIGGNTLEEMAGQRDAEVLDGTRRFEMYQNWFRGYELPESTRR